MSKRKPLGNSQRFRILERDGFRCQYCGRTPPAVVLHVDHIIPVVEGGGNEPENLCAACSDCNHGKHARPLDPDAVPCDYAALSRETQERSRQLRAYRKHLVALQEEIDQAIDLVGAAFWGPGRTWAYDRRERRSAEIFLRRLGLADTIEAARISYERVPKDPARQFRYFCGICWKKCAERGIMDAPGGDE